MARRQGFMATVARMQREAERAAAAQQPGAGGGAAGGRAQTGRLRANQPASPDGAVNVETASARIRVNLARLASDVSSVLLVTSGPGGSVRVTVTEQDGAARVLSADGAVETVLICAEVYRRQGGWRLRAVGQGYADGLAGLARDHGVEIE